MRDCLHLTQMTSFDERRSLSPSPSARGALTAAATDAQLKTLNPEKSSPVDPEKKSLMSIEHTACMS